MGDWNVDVDGAKNRLYIKIAGRMSVEEAEESTRAVIDGAERLDEGFEVITDLGEFVPGDQEAVAKIEKGKQAITANGAAAAVRVVPDSASATGQMHFERVGEDEEGYAVAMAESVEQAEKLLDKRREQMA